MSQARLEATLDHVAVAVPDAAHAEHRWVHELGGRLTMWYPFEDEPFRARQYRYANGAKLELIEPNTSVAAESFITRFLERRGSGIHHLTIKVPRLRTVLGALAGAGVEVVDHREDRPDWHEAFIPPRAAGGVVVQLAWTSMSDAAWAEVNGLRVEPCPPEAASLEGVRLAHPDLDRAAWLWKVLGATVLARTDGLVCTWPASPLRLFVSEGASRPLALCFSGTAGLPALEGTGPPVEAVGAATS